MLEDSNYQALGERHNIPNVSRSASPAVASHELGLRENVSLHGGLGFRLACARFEIELLIQRVQLKKIAVRFSRRRARTAITNLAKVIAPLPRAIRELLLLRNAFCQLLRICRQIIEHPMHPVAHRRIWTIHDQSKTLRARRRAAPGNRWRKLGSIACELFWDRSFGMKGAGGDVK